MLSALLLLACTGAEPEPAEAPEQAHEDAHASPHKHMQGAVHDGKRAHDDATMHHRFDDVERWTQVFDDPERDAWQKPAALVAALQLKPGQAVADVGAGTGYFNAHLAKAVGAEGRVIAVDIEESLVAHMAKRAEKEGTPQVEARLGAAEDPKLAEAEADLIMMVDVYHHVSARVDYFTRLRASLKPEGRLVIVDFKEGELPVGPPPEARIPAAKVDEELSAAGYRFVEALELLPHQFVRVYEVST